MANLSWPGVLYLVEALKKPLERRHAVEAIATVGGVQPSTARAYLTTAQALHLVTAGPGGSLALASPADAPTLLSASALVRLAKAAQQLTLRPNLDNGLEAADRLGVRGNALRSAWHLARHSPYA
ncbi:MAG TPA: hypothetical protein VFS00_03660, partial [Polyangiaceae bacterium]|nr:hypothetical protein [Polyangiaceae bacterium]